MRYLLGLLILFLCVDCSSTSGGSEATKTTVRLDDSARRDLVTINSIKVAPVQIGDQVPRSEVLPRFDEILRGEIDSGLDIQVVDANGDGTLRLTLTTLNERVGGKMGAEEPAAIGYEMSLIRASDNKIIWTTQFAKHDQALSTDLIKIGDKFGKGSSPTWKSTEDLFRMGIKGSIRELQERRMAAFIAH